MNDSSTQCDGAGLEVRLDGAEKLMAHERDRDQSLNTRAIAVAAAAVALMSLLARPVQAAIDLEASPAGHIGLVAAAAVVVVAALAVVLIGVLGVLRPSAREGLTTAAMKQSLEDDGMAESEQTASYELLDATIKATDSRRDVNAGKAKWLKHAYLALLVQAVVSASLLVTLAVQ